MNNFGSLPAGRERSGIGEKDVSKRAAAGEAGSGANRPAGAAGGGEGSPAALRERPSGSG
jgi:hypothetical protein